jgi:hypothetical protein
MLDQRRGIGAVAAGLAVERRPARLGGKADHRTQRFRSVVAQGCGTPGLAQARRRQRAWPAATGHHQRARRIGIVAAGVEQHDGDGRDPLQLGKQRADRHQIVDRAAARRPCRIDWHQEILAARLHAMAGIVDQRDIGIGRVLGKALQRPLQPPPVAVEHRIDVKAKIGEQLVDFAGVVGGIGEGGEVPVGRLADHQRYAAQRLAVLGKRLTEWRQAAKHQHQDTSRPAPRHRRLPPHPTTPSPDRTYSITAVAARWRSGATPRRGDLLRGASMSQAACLTSAAIAPIACGRPSCRKEPCHAPSPRAGASLRHPLHRRPRRGAEPATADPAGKRHEAFGDHCQDRDA